MSLDDQFNDASERVKSLPSRPSNETLLELYSLYKQGTAGDVQGSRPGMFNFEGRAKYDAWAKLKGMGSEEAKKKYVALVESLEKG